MNLDLSPLSDLLADEAGLVQWGWQAAVLLASATLGYLLVHLLWRRLKSHGRWTFGERDFGRVAVPLAMLVFLWAGKYALARFQTVTLLQVAQSLLLAWLAIRVAVYVLGRIIPEGALLRVAIRSIAWVAWIAVALHVTGLLPDVLEAMDSIGFTVGKEKQRLTLLLVVQALAALALAFTVTLWLGRITEARVMAVQHVQMSTRVVVTKLVRFASIVVAVLVALPMVGIDITALSVFSGALGVGLGLGLQKIAANYVAGFIVLLDRSLRIGDVVTVDNRRGEVKAIESRYTVLRALDGTEWIVPNEILIAQIVTHHTYTDPKVTVTVEVSVAYEADVDRACELLVQVARRQSRVLAEPAPAARVRRLADSGVDLSLTVWVADPELGEGDLRDGLLRDLLRSFREAGIEIPYPTRDVRLRGSLETAQKA